MRSHGWARDMEKKFKLKLEKKYRVNEFTSLFTFYYSGFNIRSSDLNAKLGIEQLKKLNRISLIRHKNFKYYEKKLNNFWKQESDLETISSFGYATFVKNRLKVFKYLKKRKIESRPLICGNMGQQPFLKKICLNKKDLINAKFVNEYGIYLPNHANISFDDIDFICKEFKSVAIPIDFKK